jgi:hypothetical protein
MSSFSVLNSVILTENEELHRCVPLSTQHHIFQLWFNMSRHTPVVVPCDLDGTLWNNVNPDDFPPPQFWQSGGRHESSWGFTYWGVDWFIHIIYSYFIHIFIHIYIYISIFIHIFTRCSMMLIQPVQTLVSVKLPHLLLRQVQRMLPHLWMELLETDRSGCVPRRW